VTIYTTKLINNIHHKQKVRSFQQ